MRRSVSIKDAAVVYVQTEYDASSSALEGEIVDSFLLSVLRDKRRDYHLTDIIKTIQQNQNEIMRQPSGESFLVQGCAGSGKTIVMLHRLSYLAFNDRNVDFSRYVVVTPSDAFNKHVESLSRDLGIEKMPRFTAEEFYAFLIKRLSFGDTYVELLEDGNSKNRYKIVVPDAVELVEDNLGDDLLKEIYSSAFIDDVMAIPNERFAYAMKECARLNLDAVLSKVGLEKPSSVTNPYPLFVLLGKASRTLGEKKRQVDKELEEARKQLDVSVRSLDDEAQRIARAETEIKPALEAVHDCALKAAAEYAFQSDALLTDKESVVEDLERAVEELVVRRREHAASKKRMEKLESDVLSCQKTKNSLEHHGHEGLDKKGTELRQIVEQRRERLESARSSLQTARADAITNMSITTAGELTQLSDAYEAVMSRIKATQVEVEAICPEENNLSEGLDRLRGELDAVNQLISGGTSELSEALEGGQVPLAVLESCDEMRLELEASQEKLSSLGLFSFAAKRALRDRIETLEGLFLEALLGASRSYRDEIVAECDAMQNGLHGIADRRAMLEGQLSELHTNRRELEQEVTALESRLASLKRLDADGVDNVSAGDSLLEYEIDTYLEEESARVTLAESVLRKAEADFELHVREREERIGELAALINAVVVEKLDEQLYETKREESAKHAELDRAKEKASRISKRIDELTSMIESLKEESRQCTELAKSCESAPYPELDVCIGDEQGELGLAIQRYRSCCDKLGKGELDMLRTSQQRLVFLEKRVGSSAARIKELEDENSTVEADEICKDIEELARSLDIRECYSLVVDLLANAYSTWGQEADSQHYYRHLLVISLALCVSYYGRRGLNLECLCIDEAQDLSIAEYEIMHRLLGQDTAINLYGDVNQRICRFRGVSKWDELPAISSMKRYELRENYRNTLQVTEYCNEEFGFDITGVGLAGPEAKAVHISDAVQGLFAYRARNDRARLAIIHKRGLAGLVEYFGDFLGKDASWGQVDFSKVSIIDVEASKGLEFDSVVVIDNLMEQNELYIAFTRTLDELYVSHIHGLDNIEAVSMISAGLDDLANDGETADGEGDLGSVVLGSEDAPRKKGEGHNASEEDATGETLAGDYLASLFDDYEYTVLDVEETE